jgi:hypothetical protein
MMMTRGSRPLLLASWTLLVPCYARAAEPTKLECIAANDAAQDLRRTGKLREAREKLVLCEATSCPKMVREDCGQRLTEVDGVMPSVIFEAKDSAGTDLAAVTVTMDGQRVTDKLDGVPLQLDPGEHRFSFESEGLRTEKTIVVREGEGDRRETVVLRQPVRSMTPTPSASNTSPQSTIALVLGVAGVVGLVVGSVLGLVSKSTYSHALQTECGNNPNGCSPQGIQDGRSAHGQAAASTVAFVAGAALLGGGVLFYFTAPTPSAVGVSPTVGTTGAGLSIVGSW